MFENVERYTTKEMVTDLAHLQGVIQVLLRNGNADGAESIVASYGARLEHNILFFTDPGGQILSSTRMGTIGRNWNEINESVDPSIVERVLQIRRYDVQLSLNQENIYGYVDICIPDESATLLPVFNSRWQASV